MINIIYEDNHLLVVEKPVNIPVQEDSSKDPDLLSILKRYLKEKYNKPGNVYLGLVHRLDRPVGGLMVFAKTSKSAARLSEQMRNKEFSKIYYIIVEGKPETRGKFEDYILKDEKLNKVSINPKGKYSSLKYEVIKTIDDYSLIKIELETGRSHQIRIQFSSRGYPIWGDIKYNSNSKIGEQIALFASSITFYHPTTKELLKFNLNLPQNGIWKKFNKNTNARINKNNPQK